MSWGALIKGGLKVASALAENFGDVSVIAMTDQN